MWKSSDKSKQGKVFNSFIWSPISVSTTELMVCLSKIRHGEIGSTSAWGYPRAISEVVYIWENKTMPYRVETCRLGELIDLLKVAFCPWPGQDNIWAVLSSILHWTCSSTSLCAGETVWNCHSISDENSKHPVWIQAGTGDGYDWGTAEQHSVY